MPTPVLVRLCVFLNVVLLICPAWGRVAEPTIKQVQSSRAHHIPLAMALPIDGSGVLRIGQRGRFDQKATIAAEGEKGFVLVYDSFADGELLGGSTMLSARSLDGLSIESPQPFAPVGANLLGSSSFVNGAGKTYLYFESANHEKEQVQLWRVQRVGDGWGRVESLHAIPALERFLNWPRWVNAGDRIVLSFRDRRSTLHWALGSTQDGFASPKAVPDSKGAYARVVPMTGGGWLASYQRREPDRHMVTWVRMSKDGDQWSEPEPLFWPKPPDRPEVHDAFALSRADRGVDVYYLFPSNHGTSQSPRWAFDLYRRAIFGPGEMGAVQRLTGPSGIEPLAPTAHRLPSGEVLVSFADILVRESAAGRVDETQLILFRLPGDAPQ